MRVGHKLQHIPLDGGMSELDAIRMKLNSLADKYNSEVNCVIRNAIRTEYHRVVDYSDVLTSALYDLLESVKYLKE